MTEKEELFAKFFVQSYNKGMSIETMTLTQLDDWIQELEKTVLEAKATIHGATQAKRERVAKLDANEREKVRLRDIGVSTSDAISAVNKRKDRLSKKEKLEETYRGLGMSEDDIKEMLSKISVDENTQERRKNIIVGEIKPKEEKKSLIDKIVESVTNAADKPKPAPIDFDDLDNLFKKA